MPAHLRPSAPTGLSPHPHRQKPACLDPYRPPRVPMYAVPRRRLLFLLDVAARQRLTTLVAPAGYGKTLLLSQWVHARPGPQVRWLTLEPGDNDIRVLLGRLHDALEPEGGADPAAVLDGGERPRLTAVPAVDAEWLARLHLLPPTTLVLDDFHQVSDPAVLDELATLIEHAPRVLRTVIATQTDPPSRFYHLGLTEALVELRQRDLAFRADEAGSLVAALTNTRLAPEQAARLVDRTEGWAIGLHLAALSLRSQDDVDAFIEGFSGSDGDVAEYLTENVLARLPASLQDFLLRTSVLDRMNGSLCDALTGCEDGEATLEGLVRRSIFISLQEPGSRWYRYHHLFRSTMRRGLRDRDPGLEQAVLHAAAAWHLGRSDMETGMRYLAEAGDWSALYETVASAGPELLAGGATGAAAALIASSPCPLREANPSAMLLEAAGWAIDGRVQRSMEVLDAVERSPTASAGQRAVGLLIRAVAALRDGLVGEAVAAASGVMELTDPATGTGSGSLPDLFGLTPHPAEVAAAATLIRGAGLLYEGRIGEAVPALRSATRAEHPAWQVAALGVLALAEAWSGRLTVAEEMGRRSLMLAGGSALDHLVSPAAYIALATVARERAAYDQAGAWLGEAHRSLATNGDRVSATLVIIEEALLAGVGEGPSAGLASLKAHRPGAQRPVPAGVVTRWQVAEAQLLTLADQRDAAVHALGLAPVRTTEVVALDVLSAADRGDLARARALAADWPDQPRPRAELERTLILAVLDQLEGDADQARRRLASVAEYCAREGWIGLFRSRHVAAAARSLYREAPNPFLRMVCEAPMAPPAARRVRGMVEQLTDREYMLLPLLPTRLSNAEMADALGVSLNTVKTHLKHIYRKLGVQERSEAIAAAEELHLW